MKQLLISVALGTLFLSSCSEVIDVSPTQSNAIGFENAVMKQSRAGDAPVSELTNETFDKFLVFGFYTKGNDNANPVQVFSGETVTKDNGVWTYKNTRYWIPDAHYNFFAYSCSDIGLDNTYGTVGLNLNGSAGERQLIFSNYRCDSQHNHDLIVAASKNYTGQAITSDNETPNPNVTFSFKHMLAKLDAKFISEFAGEYDIVIKDVRIENFRNIGQFTSNVEKWTADREKDANGNTKTASIQLKFNTSDGNGVSNAKELNEDGTVKREANTPQTQSIFMIPFEYSHNDVQIKFTIELYKGVEHTSDNLVMSRNLIGTWSPKWENGMYYTYNIRLTGSTTNLQAIVFQTADDMNLDNWGTGSSTATDISFSAN